MLVVGLSFAAMADPGDTLGSDRLEPDEGDGSVELTIVTLQFDTSDPGALLGVLSKYVVLTRMEPGCRNVDLCSSYTRPGRYLLIQKWDSPAAQRRHFDSPVMVEMATSCNGLLTAPPEIDLWDGPSAHDLR
jgi:quinol monooxygenase YgiN